MRSSSQIATPSMITPKKRLISSIQWPARGSRWPPPVPKMINGTPMPMARANREAAPVRASPVPAT